MDLLSSIIRFRARQSATHLGFLGCQVQAWFLRELGRHNPEHAKQLHTDHDEHSTQKISRPYTVSTLMKGEYPPRILAVGDWCWVRVTTLTEELSELLLNQVLPSLLPINHIGPVELEVESWKEGPPDESLIQSDTYAGLLLQVMASSETRISLDFASPTTFKQKNKKSGIEKDNPLPAPDMVFGSYLNHWLAYSGMEIDKAFGEFVEDYLAVNELHIRSERVQFSSKETQRAATSFVGQVRYAILRNKGKGQFGPIWEHYSNIARMLAAFSFYCGTGHHTTIGMGQTRPLPAQSIRESPSWQ